MKQKSNISKSIALVSLMLVGSCGVPTTQSSLDSSVPSPQGELPIIGMGYDSLNARVTGTNCFNQLPIEVIPANEAHLDFYRNLGSEQLSNLLDAGIEVGVPVYPGITVKGRARYTEEYAAGRFAETMTLHFKTLGARSRVYFGDDSLGPNDAIKANDRLDKLFNDANVNAVRGLCGDSYVSEVEKGAEFTATLKMEFNNEFQRNAYAAGFGAEILGGVVKVDVDASYEKLMANSNVNVSLAVEQKGGVPLEILNAISSDVGDAQQPENLEMPEREKQILNELKTGITFLNCTFETRVACYAVFQKLVKAAQGLQSKIQNDGIDADRNFVSGNLIPISIKTMPYPVTGELRKAALGTEEESILTARFLKVNELRGKILSIYKETNEARRRAESVNLNDENLGVLIGNDSADIVNSDAFQFLMQKYRQRAARLDAVVAKADRILGELAKVEETCWDAQLMRTEAGLKHCADGVVDDEPEFAHVGVNGLDKLISGAELFIDPRDLIGDPESFTEWCYYTYAPRIYLNDGKSQILPEVINADEAKTVEALMLYSGVAVPIKSETLLNSCFNADKVMAQRVDEQQGKLELIDKRIYSVKPLASFPNIKYLNLTQNSITDPAPLSRLRNLSTLNLDQNKLKSFSGLELIHPIEEAVLSVSGNQISGGLVDVLNNPEFKWQTLRFGKNPLTRISGAVTTTAVKTLDLVNSIVKDASGLSSIPETQKFVLIACATNIPICPLTQNVQHSCQLLTQVPCL